MNLYVHVPFCVSKCRYCAFRSEAGAGADRLRDFVRLLPREIALRGLADARPATVYLGGGTPSILGPEGLSSLLAALPRPVPGAEVSVEVNPADATPALADALRAAGVTRVSVGAQSFSPRALAWLGRRHGPGAVRSAFAAFRAAGIPSLSLDLIAALPGAPPGEYSASLREAVSLEPDHVSVYPLSVEPGTPLRRAGVAPPSAEEALAAVAEAEETLGAAGYVRYELSNYARPGSECRHNLAVWRGEDYIGLGDGAYGRIGLSRTRNWWGQTPRNPQKHGGQTPSVETVDEKEDLKERTIFRLRTRDGLDASRFPEWIPTLDRFVADGLLVKPGEGSIYRLTERGAEVCDYILSEIV